MKMIYCTCNVSVLEPLTELLEKCHIRDYQVLDMVTAKNKKGDPRFNNPVWPGYNSSVLMQVSDAGKVKSVIESIRSYNKTVINDDELVTVCSWNLEEYIFD